MRNRREHLVVVRAPTSELHADWPDRAPDRSWDLIVSTFREEPQPLRPGQLEVVLRSGLRWPAMVEILDALGPDLGGYSHVWLAPDDVVLDPSKIDDLFALMHRFGLGLAQPALSHDSWFSHPVTLEVSTLLLRYTNFVEVMVPCFRRDVMLAALPLMREARYGWGMDWAWVRYADGGRSAGVLDAFPVRHARPIGSELHTLTAPSGETAWQEMRRVQVDNCVSFESRIFRAVDRDGTLTPPGDALSRLLREGVAAATEAGLADPGSAAQLSTYVADHAAWFRWLSGRDDPGSAG